MDNVETMESAAHRVGRALSLLLCWLIAAAAGALVFYYMILPETLSAETCAGISSEFCGARLVERSGGQHAYTVCGMEIKPVQIQ